MRSVRSPLTDEELTRLTAYDFGKIKLTEGEKLRLRAINERRRQEGQSKAAEWARAEAPLVEALKFAGVPVSSVWNLVNVAGRKRPSRPFMVSTDPPEALWDWLDANGGSYAAVVPLLLDHLRRPYPDRVREGIARALAVPESRAHWDELVNRYLAETDTTTNGIKWALHLAISAAADITVLDTLIRLACDRRHGRNRALFVDALARIDDPRARAALAELASDPDLADDVRRVTKKRRQ
ncbi:MAG TPA: hypothetical protein VGN30_14550 [Steroidobacteraceae bacterium]|jgi:hypothetical protein